jgi:hypothetical protein
VGRSLLLLALLCACPGPKDDAPDEDPILARVGPRVIRFHELQAAARARTEPGLLPRSGAGWEDLRARLLKDRLVEEVLLLDGRERELSVDPVAVQAELDAASGDVRDDARLAAFVTERHGSRDAWVASVERRLGIEAAEAALRAELAAAVTIAPEQVDSAAERFAAQMTRPARLRVRQMFFPDADSARGALLQLQEGADFAELVRSLTGEDGDSGLMSEDSVPPLVLTVTASLEPGSFTDVVPSPLGYHLYQLLERQEGGPLDEDAARADVERRLREEAVDSRLKAWIAARTDALGLFVDEDAVALVGCCRQGMPYVGPDKEGS